MIPHFKIDLDSLTFIFLIGKVQSTKVSFFVLFSQKHFLRQELFQIEILSFSLKYF